MSEPAGHDPRFSLPALDDPADTETGVILLGLDTDRLLAGLGLASLADDPAALTLAVDELRHDAAGRFSFAALVEAGAHRWHELRPAVADATTRLTVSASPRQVWTRTSGAVAGALPVSPAAVSYLVACWLRRADVDGRAAHPADGSER